MKLCPSCESGYHDSHTTCPTHGSVLHEIRELKPGMKIRDTYRIVRKLGEGGMGTVYLADHLEQEELRALKFISSSFSEDEDFEARFKREARTNRRIRHKNVVDCDSLERAEDGTLFFSMEFVEGPSEKDKPDLWAFLHRSPRPFDVVQALAIARGIAEGLGAAHEINVVHRDIKPENILMARVGEKWVPKIADFGIVAVKEGSRPGTRSRTSASMLSWSYAAPEQWLGKRAADLDGRTDLYALGGILFEMLTGETAFHADSYEGWAEQHKNAAPPWPSELRPDLACWQGLDELVVRLLAKDRENRPHDVAELLRELDALQYSPRVTVRQKMKVVLPVRAKTQVETGPELCTGASGTSSAKRTETMVAAGPELTRSIAPQSVGGRMKLLIVPGALLVLIGLGIGAYQFWPQPAKNQPPSPTLLTASCDVACEWKLNGETMGRIESGQSSTFQFPVVPVNRAVVEAVAVDKSLKSQSKDLLVHPGEDLHADFHFGTGQNQPPAPSPVTAVIVSCDQACNWKLDDSDKGRIEAGGSKQADVAPGQHTVVATAADGSAQPQQRDLAMRAGSVTAASFRFLDPVLIEKLLKQAKAEYENQQNCEAIATYNEVLRRSRDNLTAKNGKEQAENEQRAIAPCPAKN